jgi:hypothetical protein
MMPDSVGEAVEDVGRGVGFGVGEPDGTVKMVTITYKYQINIV